MVVYIGFPRRGELSCLLELRWRKVLVRLCQKGLREPNIWRGLQQNTGIARRGLLGTDVRVLRSSMMCCQQVKACVGISPYDKLALRCRALTPLQILGPAESSGETLPIIVSPDNQGSSFQESLTPGCLE